MILSCVQLFILITSFSLMFHTASFAKKKMINTDMLIEQIQNGEFAKIKNNLDQHLKFKDKNKTTLLMIAAQNGNFKVLEYLLSKKINLQATDIYGVSALGYAIGNEQIKTAQLLIDKGISLDTACSEEQKNILVCAIEVNSKELVQLIADKNKKLIQMQDSAGNTPLHIAAETSTSDILAILIKSGADLKAKNKKGEIPYDLAKQMNLQENMKLLAK